MPAPFRLKNPIGEAYNMSAEDTLNTKKALTSLGHMKMPDDGLDEYPDLPMIDAVMVLWVFAVFWHLTTGTWRHYLPTRKGLWQVARYYAYGIFKGERHPYRKAYWRKHNPLQALSYLLLKVALFPAIWATGLAYLFFNAWSHLPHARTALEWIAQGHIIAAFALIVFIIAHVYLLTTGHSFTSHVKPMIDGYDEVDLTEAEQAYLEQDETSKIQ